MAISSAPRDIGLREALQASMLLSPDEQKGYVRGLAGALASVEDVSCAELVDAMVLTSDTWEAAAAGAPREAALQRIRSDNVRLAGIPGRSLSEVAQGLVQAGEARQARLTNVARLGIGGALAGFMGAMALPHPALQGLGLAVGLVSVATAGIAAVQKYRTPEVQTLVRLGGYAAVALETRKAKADAQEVRDLVDSLGRATGPEVRLAPEGVQIGGIWLPRRNEAS